MRTKIFFLLLFGVFGILIWVGMSQLSQEQQTILNYVSVYGTYFTICGFLITIIQVWHIKKISEETQLAVTNSQNKIKHILSISDFSKCVKIIQEIQGYITNNKIDSAILRLLDIKEHLIFIKLSPEFEGFANTKTCQNFIVDIGIHTQTLRDFLETGREFNIRLIMKDLDALSTLFIEIETSLKQKAYDTK